MTPSSITRLSLGIPQITARAAAMFRILLGVLLVLLLLAKPGLQRVDPDAAVVQPGSGNGVGTWAVMHWVRASPNVHRLAYLTATVGCVGFLLGFWTRVSAAVLWCSLFVLIGVSLVTSGQHNWGVPLIALMGVVVAPLGDAWSIDARLRHRSIQRSPQAYGMALWWIGFALGSAYLAAAYAKLSTSGIAWVTTGAVRFHFMEDVANAPVSLGIWVAGHEWVAIVLSAAAILTEGTFILVTLCRSDGWRTLAGLAGAALHLGFFLFQGVLWLPWIVLYVAFLPWESISRRLGSEEDGMRLDQADRSWWGGSPAYGIALAYVLTTQVYASARHLEYEPLLSSMPMYSSTYSSWDTFFAQYRWSKYQTYAFHVGGADIDDAMLNAIVTRDADPIISSVRARCAGQSVSSAEALRLTALHHRVSDYLGRDIDEVEVLIESIREVDFAASRLNTKRVNLHLATLRLSTATLSYVAPDSAICRATATSPSHP